MDNIERTNTLLSQAGLPLFPVDSNGFPVPGAVVRYFREQMVYIDDNGKERHWSQSFLAKQLHVAELAVRLMETRNEGLDSVERRQLLAALLHIPPALLGLASYDYLQDSLQGQKKTPSYMTSKTSIGMEELQLYHDGLVIFKEAYATSQLDETRIEP